MNSDPVSRFKNGLVVSTAPDWAENNPEIIQQWIEWRIANPIEPAAYQAQLAIGLGLLSETAAFEDKLHHHMESILFIPGPFQKAFKQVLI